jgi:tRNA modification GTPase
VAPDEARVAIDAAVVRIDTLLVGAARGRLVREGAQVAIVGAPNVGKSSLFNALLGANRAIVTDIPGTTRDLVTERADIGGLSLSLIDTAGVRETGDIIEQEGVARARHSVRVADLTLVVLDRSRPLSADDRDVLTTTAGRRRLIVLNKSDLPAAGPEDIRGVEVSATTGAGLERLIAAIGESFGEDASELLRDQPLVTNVRHADLLARAREALIRASAAMAGNISEEFPLADLQDAAHLLQEITGRRTTDDLLRHIFERFCIGK